MEGKSQMVDNAPVKAAEAVEAVTRELTSPPKAPEPEQQPEGTVKRVLHFRDRQLLIWGAREYCKTDGHGDYRCQTKYARVRSLLLQDEVDEYFAMLDDDLQERRFEWQRKTNDYLLYRQYQAGSLPMQDLVDRAPHVRVDQPPPKQSLRQPVLSRQEQEFKARAFYLPSKVDVWIQDMLKNLKQWPDNLGDFVMELAEKFGVKDD